MQSYLNYIKNVFRLIIEMPLINILFNWLIVYSIAVSGLFWYLLESEAPNFVLVIAAFFVLISVSVLLVAMIVFKHGIVIKEEGRDIRKEIRRSHVQRESTSFQGFSRNINENEAERLCESWANFLSMSFDPNHIQYLGYKLRYIEQSCAGRMAGNIQDAIIHLLVAEALTSQGRLEYLEIGGLFGINSIGIYDISKCYFKSVGITILDPLDGYYGHNSRDPFTGLPINKNILIDNFNKHNIPSSDYKIIEKYSTDKEAISEASRKKYNYLFIDGDHSYDGIKFDFDNYSGMIENRGFLVIDDYGQKAWPSVKEFVDSELMQSKQFKFIGYDCKTIVFRKVGEVGV